MKRFFVAAIAVVVAITAFAFTNNRDVRATCNDDLIWFNLLTGEDFNCGNFTSVQQGDVIGLPRTSANPIADLAALPKTRPEQIVAQPSCIETSIKVCAVGYEYVASSFVAGTQNGQPVWLPATTAVPVCQTCKTTIP